MNQLDIEAWIAATVEALNAGEGIYAILSVPILVNGYQRNIAFFQQIEIAG